MKIIRTTLPIVLYAVLAVIVFAKVLFQPQGQMLFGPDIWRYHYYTKPFLFQQLAKGTIPLWNPYTFSGQPYLEQPQLTPWYPPILLFTLLSVPQAFSWYFAFHIFLAMAGMYLFVRSLRVSGIGQIGIWPSWIAGVSFGLSTFFVARIYAGHIDVIAASSWLPVILATSLLLMDHPTRKKLIVMGLCVAMQIFAGYQTISIFTIEALVALALLVSMNRHSFRPLLVSLGGLAIGLGFAAIQLIPNAKFVSESTRSLPLPHDWSIVATPTPYHLLELLDPFFFYTRIPYVGLGHEYASYIGKLPLIFSVLLIFWVLRKRALDIYVLYFFLLCVFSWWIALAQNAPVDLWIILQKTLPFYSQLRIPSRHVLFFVFAASALAGIGYGLIKNRLVLFFVTVLVLLDLVPLAWKNIHLGPVPEMGEDPKLVEVLRDKTSLFRFLPAFFAGDSPRENLEFTTPMKYELYSASGYDTPQLRRYIEFLLAVNGGKVSDLGPFTETIPPYANVASPYTDFLNIRYVFVPLDQDLGSIDPKRFVPRIVDEARGYRLFENTHALPRFYFVPSVRVLPNAEGVLAAIGSGTVDPQSVVLTQADQNIASGDCPPDVRGEVRLVSYKNSTINLKASSPCNGFLVSSEVMYPGWGATIDGVKAPIFFGNHAFRTVALPHGVHTIVFTYRPPQLVLGIIVTLVTIIGSIVFLGLPRVVRFLP